MKNDFFRGKKILVTGGVGSIGRELVRKLLAFQPAIIRVFDNNETGLFDLDHELDSRRIRVLLGDIRDRDRLMMAFEDIDIVFHTAALKHVPLCEFNPFDAVKTNVIGTQNVLDAALVKGVEKVINVSTDKAVSPTNVMGATKLLAERLTISANYYRGDKKTIFSSVRFGNVLNSRGSVIPLFSKQIEQGGPVTVTDPGMTRFFMDIPAATDLILKAGILAQGREIFILKMPAIRITDLADVMIRELAPRFGHDPAGLRVDIVGKREGEKLHEELMSREEAERAYESREMFLIMPRVLAFEDPPHITIPAQFRKASIREFSSETADLIDQEGIRAILSQLLKDTVPAG
ncbi:MAG: polysaccharide biosynthesis protein [Methanomicrobiales archaeon]|nr:polysaccharide biosynthesis protein [Methanomicrobiales archaeon]